MKRLFILFLSICTIVFVVQAHSYEDKLKAMQEFPRTVIKEAQQALDVAMKDGNSVEMIDALMLLSAAQLQLDTDSLPMIVNQIEQVMNGCRNEVDRTVIALYLTDVYSACLSGDYYRYSRRSYIKGNADMTTWSVQNFRDKIDSLQHVALQPTRALQKTSISRYRSIIGIEGYDGDEAWHWIELFYPTMYDFVASIIYDRSFAQGRDNAYIPQGCGYTPQCQFICHSVAVADSVANSEMWHLLGNVMQFHTRRKQRAALFMWDLKRLQYTYQIEGNETDYIRALDTLIANHSRNEYVIEAVIAKYSHSLLDSTNDARALYKSILKWIERFPRYYRIGCLQSLCADMSAASVSLSMPNVLHPSEHIVANIAYSNVDSIKCVLWRCDDVQPLRNISYLNNNKLKWIECASHCVAGKGVDFETYKVQSFFESQSAGLYRLTIEAGNKNDEVVFVITPYMLLTVNSSPDEASVLLVDNMTGNAVVGEKIILTSLNNTSLQQAFTDQRGMCQFAKPLADNSYYVALANIEQYPFVQSLSFAHIAYKRENLEVRIFTDRELYRPGQTLQFSAIAYRLDDTVREVVAGSDLQVILVDNTGNEVWKGKLTTDEYGSINGEIDLPTTAALGSWRLSVSGDNIYAVEYIEVAAYKRPQFAVVCNPIEGIYSYGDSVQITGYAMNYLGAAVALGQVDYVVRRYSHWYGATAEIVAQGTTRCDVHGDFDFSFVTLPPHEAEARWFGTQYIAEVTVTSATGESRQGEIVVSVSGMGVNFRTDIPEKVSLDEKKPFNVSVINGAGVEQQLPYHISLYSTEYKENAEVVRRATALWQCDVDAGNDSIMLPYETISSGSYRMIMTTRTPMGEQVTDSVNFVCYSAHDKQPPIPVALWLPIDRYEVVNGDTLHIAVGSVLPNATLYCFVTNGDNSLECRSIALNNSMTAIKLPYDVSCDDVMQVQFVIVHHKEVHRKRVIITRKQPDMRLIITPTTFRDKTMPGSRERWQFTVRDANGSPVNALFMAEMYDASLDALSKHSWYFNPVYTPYVNRYLSIEYPWYIASDNNAYINYRTEYSSAQYVGSVLPTLRTYLSAWSRGMYGMPVYRAMTQAVNDFALSESEAIPVAEGAVKKSDKSSNDVAVTAPYISYRQSMEETAFFYPHLVTDKNGDVCVEFTVPESNTTWNFFSLAVTPQLNSGMYATSVVSSKPLMVQPNMPRFVRQGDKVVLSAAIHNTTQESMQGEALLTIYNPDDESVISVQSVPFDVDNKASAIVIFSVAIPDTLSLVGVRVGVSTDLYSDGEQHLLPVLPSTMVVTEAQSFYLSPTNSDTTMSFVSMQEKIESDEVQNLRLTLEYCDNPAWYAVSALPSLAQPVDNSAISLVASLYAYVVANAIVEQNPLISQTITEWSKQEDNMALVSKLMQNDELKQMLLSETPWLVEATNATEQLRQIASLLDVERTRQLIQESLDCLQAMQVSDGGWPWFNGMQSSFSVTLNVMAVLSRLCSWVDVGNFEPIASMKVKASAYLDAQYLRHNEHSLATPDYQDLCYLYVRSALLDIPLADEVLAVQHQQLDSIRTQWYRYDEIEKAYAAVVLYRCGYVQDAEKIINSLREYAVLSHNQGMYWPNNRSYSFYRNSAIQVHCALYEAFALVSPRISELDAMRQWLLLQKQTQVWVNVPSTLDAINILLASGTNWLSSTFTSQIEWGNTPLPQPSQAEQIVGYAKYVRQGDDIDVADSRIVISGHDNKPSWGAVYWQYSSKIANIEAHAADEIALERQYYVERDGDLLPIENTAVVVGDVVTVKLTIRSQRDMQYMALTDCRPACFEPQEQLPQYNYVQGLYYYVVPEDATTNIYIEHLPRGVHVIEYKLYADRQGAYQAGISTLQSYYDAQFVAHTSGEEVVVTSY